jgi:hypothetical protein
VASSPTSKVVTTRNTVKGGKDVKSSFNQNSTDIYRHQCFVVVDRPPDARSDVLYSRSLRVYWGHAAVPIELAQRLRCGLQFTSRQE